jgi:hypothetical protein
MRRWALLVALLLPLLWLGASIVRNQSALGAADLWRIPITGYDPRDPLRGRYIEFAFAWEVKGDARECDRPQGCDICLQRDGAQVLAVISPVGSQCDSRVDLGLSRISVAPAFREAEATRFRSRIFVSEASAPRLEQQLRDTPMVMVAALTPDGRLVNRRIEPAN